MKKLNFKKVFLGIYCFIFFIFVVFYLINFTKLNNLKNNNISINASFIKSTSKSIKNFAIKTVRISSRSLVRTKKLESYVKIGGLELPIEGSTGYACVKMNLMLEPSNNSKIIRTLAPRNWL